MPPSRRDLLVRDQAAQSSMTTTSFFIPDNSPMISYASADGTSPWTAGYARQSDGYDETLHLTTSSNAQVSFNISASSLTFLVPQFDGCSATVSINSSTPVTACSTLSSTNSTIPFSLYNLPDGIHRVNWNTNVIPAEQNVIFWGLDGVREVEGTATNVTIDDSYAAGGPVHVGYEGTWSSVSSSSSSALSEQSEVSTFFNKTVAITQSSGSTLTFSGQGSAIYLYGPVGPDYGSASITLNGDVVAGHLNLTSPWALSYELLWFQTGLDDTVATNLSMTSLSSAKMGLDFILLSASADALSQLHVDASIPFQSTPGGKAVLYGVVPFAAVALIAFLTCYFLRRRRPSRRHSSTTQTMSLRPDQIGSWEKRGTVYSTSSSPSEEDMNVFVSYEAGKGQRLSDRWNDGVSPKSPRSARSGRDGSIRSDTTTPRASPYPRGGGGLGPLQPVAESSQISPELSSGESAASWIRPFHSILGSNYARSSRRVTALPAYTLESSSESESHGTHTAHNDTSTYQSAEAEKAILAREFDTTDTERNTPSPYSHPAGPSSLPIDNEPVNKPSAKDQLLSRVQSLREGHLSTLAPSSIMSVFGAPPSLRRSSTITAITTVTSEVERARPTIVTDLSRVQPARPSAPTPSRTGMDLPNSGRLIDLTPSSMRSSTFSSASSPGSALRAWVALPPTAFTFAQKGRIRTQSTATAGSEVSAARPDSDVIPYDASPVVGRKGGFAG
ncbi:hypothetical protein M231_04247 [Tremella mesenterica]|uniref:Uncharacterized protein n=1 Tax=Tremella mesenterica TaxID=5217 RepID=A0A4Q1BLG9_TREME|nr:hypothetical protein M231_04247 [Tremella mesenterica]